MMRVQPQKSKKRRIILLTIYSLILGVIIFRIFSGKKEEIVTPIPEVTQFPTQNQVLGTTATPNEPLSQMIAQALEGSTGDYSIAIRNSKTAESYFQQEHKKYAAGSLYKLWIMATAYQEIEAGRLSLDDELSEEVSVLNEKFQISTEAAELSEGTVTFTVRDALRQMITISHNYAALLLSQRVRLSNVQKFLVDHNLKESFVVTNNHVPTTTANDMLFFFEKLYNGELNNRTYSDEMIELLKEQTINTKLPYYLPPDTIIAHKTGELDYVSHDAGIIYLPGNEYVIAVLSESEYPPGAIERIARISESAFNYFSQSQP